MKSSRDALTGLSGLAGFVHVFQQPGVRLILPCTINLLDPSACTFPFTTCVVVFPLLCAIMRMHIHNTSLHYGNRRNTMHFILHHFTLPEAKGRLLALDIETGMFANCFKCRCLTQCCETPKPAFTNSRRTSLDLRYCDKKPITV